jgi:putative phage-type endonuclease
MKIIECEQRTPEWFAARAGKITGSVAGDVLAKLKSGLEPASRRDLRISLAIERFTGKPMESDGFVNAAMQRGIDKESDARMAYQIATSNEVRQTGFVVSDDNTIGCSLDGDVDGFKGIIEIKCPKTATHIQTLKERKLPADYRWQVTHNLLVTSAVWCDFVSFDDRMPFGLQLVVIRVNRSELDLDTYRIALAAFNNEIDAEVESLQKLQQGILL